MRYKGKLIKWNADKASGFIQPNGGGVHIFIHKNALFNKKRTPQINDIITFSVTKSKNGQYSASDATFLGEKLKERVVKNSNQFSMYLSLLFLVVITAGYVTGQFPQTLLFGYFCFSTITFLVYAFDKSKSRHGSWRTPESTLHLLSLMGGWPGAAIAQQLLRHKSHKREFRKVFWLTVIVNVVCLMFALGSYGPV